MHRVDTPDAVGGLYDDGNPLIPRLATYPDAAAMNALQEEIANVIEQAGIALVKADNTQLLAGLLLLAAKSTYGLDTGVVANSYVVALTPVPAAYKNGQQVRFRATHANNGACTLNAGAGVKLLKRGDGTALILGDILVNSIVSCTYDAPSDTFLVNSIVQSQITAALALAVRYLNAGAVLTRATTYLIDTSAGPVAVSLPANPTLGDAIELMDPNGTWATNNMTLLRNGQTIEGVADDLACDVDDQQFTIWFNGADWRLL